MIPHPSKRPADVVDERRATRARTAALRHIDEDPHSDNQHQQWDAELIAKNFGNFGSDHLPYLLLSVVKQCKTLDRTYCDLLKAEDLLQDNPELVEELKEALAAKSFRSIRNLAILHLPSPQQLSEVELRTTTDELQVARDAWDTIYYGDTSHLLRICIDDMNYHRGTSNYRNFAAIIQSSGTGKSRSVDEMAKSIFTLPFNLRNPQETSGFPLPDKSLYQYFRARGLDGSRESHDQLKTRYLLFFHRLLKDVIQKIAPMQRQPRDEFASKWRNMLADGDGAMRNEMFAQAIIEPTAGQVNMAGAIALAVGSARELLDMIEQKSIDVDDSGNNPEAPRKPVRLFMYFDEAHDMTEDLVNHAVTKKGKPNNEADATHLVKRSAFMALCSTLNEFSDLDIFTIFLSTYSSLSKFAPSKIMFFSDRARDADYELQAPFIEMAFDVWKEKYLVKENKHTLREVCKTEFMVRFSRPLWWTRWEKGNTDVRRNFINFVCAKLKGVSQKQKENRYGDLAALSIRLLLEFEPRREAAIATEKVLVAGHMRIIFSVPDHLEYLRSGTPSEPILAEAAAQIMANMEIPVLTRLTNEMENGLISKGERGELVARLLLTLAHDKAIEANQGSESIQYSQPIRLLDFLSALFQPHLVATILQCRAQNIAGCATLGEAFKDAYVHFTHFAKATSAAIMSDEAAWIAMCRGMAWQCQDRQDLVNIALPVLLWNTTIGRYVMTIVAIQIRNKAEHRSVHIDLESPKINFFTPSLTDKRANTRPYITLILELGVQPSATRVSQASEKPSKQTIVPPFNASGNKSQAVAQTTPSKLPVSDARTRSTRKRAARKTYMHPRYVIRARGCSSTVYRVIEDDEKAIYARLLASRDLLNEHPRQKGIFLDAVLAMKPFWEPGRPSFGWVDPVGLEITSATQETAQFEDNLTVDDFDSFDEEEDSDSWE